MLRKIQQPYNYIFFSISLETYKFLKVNFLISYKETTLVSFYIKEVGHLGKSPTDTDFSVIYQIHITEDIDDLIGVLGNKTSKIKIFDSLNLLISCLTQHHSTGYISFIFQY